MPTPILYDCDPGIDDTHALLLALRSPELEVAGITCCFGNAHVETTARNARRVLELVGRSGILVAQGAAQPLVRDLTEPPAHIHGHDGLGDAGLAAEPTQPLVGVSAAQFIVETLMARPREITLVAVAPLTNLALALRLEPRIARAARRVVIMGGTLAAPGNMSPVAEANIYHDPEAAGLVFAAGWPLVMVGLDVTTRVVMDDAYLQRLRSAANPYTDLACRIAPLYREFHRTAYGMDGFHVHDPSAIAYCVDPTLFRTACYPARVETQGHALGQVIGDRQGRFYDGPRVEFCVDVDAPRLLELFARRLMGSG